MKDLEKKIEILEKKIDSLIELFSPNTNNSFTYSSGDACDDIFTIQEKIARADQERVKRNRLLINFRNEAKNKYDDFSDAPREEQDLLEELIFNSAYAVYVTKTLRQELGLYKTNFYKLISGEINHEKFKGALNESVTNRIKGFEEWVWFDKYTDKPLLFEDTDFFRVLKEETKKRVLECTTYINK